MKARIRIVSGPLTGQAIELSDSKVLIGREADCQLRPPCEFLSRHHCALLVDELTVRIRDLGSKNGTFVNGRRIGMSEVILLHDDLVSIGTTNLLIDLYFDTVKPEQRTESRETRLFESRTVEGGAPPPAPTDGIQQSGECVDRATD
jgi:pSer/pThr/pTyr-binding forkhead associated (FHA) protein